MSLARHLREDVELGFFPRTSLLDAPGRPLKRTSFVSLLDEHPGSDAFVIRRSCGGKRPFIVVSADSAAALDQLHNGSCFQYTMQDGYVPLLQLYARRITKVGRTTPPFSFFGATFVPGKNYDQASVVAVHMTLLDHTQDQLHYSFL